MAEVHTSVDRRSLIDVYGINENGEEYVHSIIVNADQKWVDFRQVIRPSTPLTDAMLFSIDSSLEKTVALRNDRSRW